MFSSYNFPEILTKNFSYWGKSPGIPIRNRFSDLKGDLLNQNFPGKWCSLGRPSESHHLGSPETWAELSCATSSAGTCCLGWGKSLMLWSLSPDSYLTETLSQTLIQMVNHEIDKTRDFFTSWSIREAHKRGKTHQRENGRDPDLQTCERLPGMEINQIRAIAAEGCAYKEARMWREMSEGILTWRGNELYSGKAIFNMVLVFSALLRGVGKCHPTCW